MNLKSRHPTLDVVLQRDVVRSVDVEVPLVTEHTKGRSPQSLSVLKLCNYEFKDLCELNLIISPEDTTCGEYFLMKAEIMS